MCVLVHGEAQGKSQINPPDCFHLLARGTQARVFRGVWVQAGFCSGSRGGRSLMGHL